MPLKELRARDREKELEGVYDLKDLGMSLENRQIILVDDVVTTGATSRAIVRTILNKFPTAKINAVALGWTPTVNQQQLLLDQQRTKLVLHEPIPSYGNRPIGYYDQDYVEGETFIKL
ncbi:DNA utilization protein GntX [compost metagenome]